MLWSLCRLLVESLGLQSLSTWTVVIWTCPLEYVCMLLLRVFSLFAPNQIFRIAGCESGCHAITRYYFSIQYMVLLPWVICRYTVFHIGQSFLFSVSRKERLECCCFFSFLIIPSKLPILLIILHIRYIYF